MADVKPEPNGSTELRPVHLLAIADRLQLPGDVRVYRVAAIDGDTHRVDGRRRVHLRTLDGSTRIVLIRAGRELVRLVAARA